MLITCNLIGYYSFNQIHCHPFSRIALQRVTLKTLSRAQYDARTVGYIEIFDGLSKGMLFSEVNVAKV